MSDSPGEGVRRPMRTREEALSLAMAEPQVRKARKGRFDPLTAAAVVFFWAGALFAGLAGWSST